MRPRHYLLLLFVFIVAAVQAVEPLQTLGHRTALTDKDAEFAAVDPALKGTWTDVFTSEKVEIAIPLESRLPAWGYRVLKSEQ